MRLIASIVRDNLASTWEQLRAVDVVVAEFAEDLGEDPLRPKLREFLDDVLARCRELRSELVKYVGPWEPPTDIDESLALARKLVERAVK